jgi:hypothetical protein
VNLVLMGPPGSGKGTQAVQLAAALGCAHLSTGALLRAEITAGTPLGDAVASVVSAGELIPDELGPGGQACRNGCKPHANKSGLRPELGGPHHRGQRSSLRTSSPAKDDAGRTAGTDCPGHYLAYRMPPSTPCRSH